MVSVVITVDLARYKGTVHYANCSLLTGYSTHHNRTIPPSVKMKTCYKCKPGKRDIVEIASEITWLEKSADAMSFRWISLDSDNENLVAKDRLGHRTLRKSMQHKYE